MQGVVHHLGRAGAAAAVAAVLLVGVSSLILAVSYRDQVTTLRHTIYLRCLQRSAYDRAAHSLAVADLAEQRALIRVIGDRHRGGDAALVAIFQHKAARDRTVIARGVIGGCAVYK